jgi:hypothetical protein
MLKAEIIVATADTGAAVTIDATFLPRTFES